MVQMLAVQVKIVPIFYRNEDILRKAVQSTMRRAHCMILPWYIIIRRRIKLLSFLRDKLQEEKDQNAHTIIFTANRLDKQHL